MSKHTHNQGGETSGPIGPSEPEAPVPQGGAPADPIQAIQKERDDLLARLQRVSADYANYQKRAQRELTQAREFANESLIKALLVVLDDVDRALQAGRTNHAPDDPLLAGMQLVRDKALQVLGGFGLVPVEAEGQPFDPEIHQAVVRQETDKFPPHTVLLQLQRGYQLKGRTIRPASVAVAAAPSELPSCDEEVTDE
jgi:molecular chaperone GrpE